MLRDQNQDAVQQGRPPPRGRSFASIGNAHLPGSEVAFKTSLRTAFLLGLGTSSIRWLNLPNTDPSSDRVPHELAKESPIKHNLPWCTTSVLRLL